MVLAPGPQLAPDERANPGHFDVPFQVLRRGLVVQVRVLLDRGEWGYSARGSREVVLPGAARNQPEELTSVPVIRLKRVRAKSAKFRCRLTPAVAIASQGRGTRRFAARWFQRVGLMSPRSDVLPRETDRYRVRSAESKPAGGSETWADFSNPDETADRDHTRLLTRFSIRVSQEWPMMRMDSP